MKSKLSPIEELRAEREKLNAEIKQQEVKLKENFSYAKDHWGSLLMGSVFSSSGNSVKSMFSGSGGSLFGKSSMLEKLTMAAPALWNIAQPFLWGIATKRLTSFIFGKKKKKK